MTIFKKSFNSNKIQFKRRNEIKSHTTQINSILKTQIKFNS
ncbi:hypothetical protein M153_7690002451 [Pseudoloma neurophilia]|uniref:Uncharacterized protein n=1 Tax=Pseudoloma neurophilia TaxID=146866 RepID=A0A0R0M578_9MICR|nr:hypothetical protein M153_7690002451 [Pseudoloma neurophilia]